MKIGTIWRRPAILRPVVWPLLGLAALLLAGCSRAKDEPPSSTVVVTNGDPNVFTMQDPGQFPLTPVQVRKVNDEVHVNGVIAPDINRSVPVVSLSGGRVVDIKAKLGDAVQKGQELLLINSPDVSGAFSDYQKFKADEALAQKQLARAKLLYDKGAIALADLETAEDSDAKAKADLAAAVQRIHVLGGDINHPSPLLPLRAPISGVIVDQQTTGGTGVRSLDNQAALFTIADLSVVWVLCDVYQDMLTRVHVGDNAEITVNGLPNEKFPGKVINISAVLDPATRTAKVRIELSNPKGILRPGMFVTATFTAGNSLNRAVVPASAVVHLHDKDWVYTPAGSNQFRRVAVQLGPQESDGQQVVISGLKAGAQVVTNALQFSSAAEE
ncbi:MAG: efflux RND transporter periplasmic adaptor subunit [Acidobacteriota bacterium]|nr:efflux RND transporter periplasmic adaptor subunit [Acidobacteriota bacterium]